MAKAKRYVYTCGRHDMGTPTPVTKCLAFVLGEPCPRPIKQTAGPRPK